MLLQLDFFLKEKDDTKNTGGETEIKQKTLTQKHLSPKVNLSVLNTSSVTKFASEE